MPKKSSAWLGLILLSLIASSPPVIAQTGAQESSTGNFLQRQHVSDVRMMSWNVRRSSVVPPDGARYESFTRIIRALEPDVIAFQEIMRPDATEKLRQLMDELLPLDGGNSWQAHSVSDNTLISRFPLLQRGGELVFRYPYPNLGLPDFHYGYATALVDLPNDVSDVDIYVVGMHNKSGAGENVALRQLQSDATLRWIRDLRDSGREMAVSDFTPIVILGDMNVVRDASTQPFDTLLSGDIIDETEFGPDFEIDWDGTDLADVSPSHNARGERYYTWRYDETPFDPGVLDRIIYTDSVLSVRQSFVLNTVAMSEGELVELGLLASDVLFRGEEGYFDHLPLVVDFSTRSTNERGTN